MNNEIEKLETENAPETFDTFKIELRKPVEYDGKEYKVLEFDFGKLTGDDGLNIENELQSLGKFTMVPAFSGEYLIRMAAKACTEKVGSDIFKKISLADYNRIRGAARSFLLRSE